MMAGVLAKQRATKVAKRRNERNILTFYEKIAVIRYYDETNISRNSLAKMFHCCATQIRRILERKEELLQQLATLSEADASIIIEEMTRKRRKFEMSAISFILHQWVERCRHLCLHKSITNQTLKETALKMAAILNLPSFRPSYRWLNRFRGKYKYNEQDLGAGGDCTVAGELSVEDIIIEFKDALPSFMQKEISAITSSAKVEEKLNGHVSKRTELPVFVHEPSEDDDDEEGDSEESATIDDPDAEVEVIMVKKQSQSANNARTQSSVAVNKVQTTTEVADVPSFDIRVNAGTSALLNSVFPHLAVIHQFALLNSDVKALELISQLGVHMQTQAADGAYKQLSLATNNQNDLIEDNADGAGNIYADMDDIVLIE